MSKERLDLLITGLVGRRMAGIEVPRDHEGSYEPLLVGKHERRGTGFDQKIITIYGRSMIMREIQGYMAEFTALRCRRTSSAKLPMR